MATVYPHIIYVAAEGQQQKFVPETTTPPPDPEPEPDGNGVLTIVHNNNEITFWPDAGEPLDDYVDPQGQFTQHCTRIVNEGLSGFTCFYRPDQAGGREEWVLEWGDLWDRTPENLGALQVRITDKRGQTYNYDLTHHDWYARWRWYSAPRPVRRTYEDLAAANLVPHIDPSGFTVPPVATVSDYSPMALCGLPANQGQTGAYPGIGPITGWQAQYFRRGAPESSFRNHLEASGSYQWHIRDKYTGAPIDAVTGHPSASIYGSEGNPDIEKMGGPTTPDGGHFPSISYVAFMLTGDPYALEEMQASANYMFLMNPPNSRLYFAGRYVAWPLRALGELCLAVGENQTLPNWMLPRSYWLHWLDWIRDQLNSRARDKSDPFYWLFCTVPEWGQASDKDPSKTGDHVWQQGMLAWAACWMACHYDDWIEAAEWLTQGQVARASSSSGWARSHPAPYHLRMRCASVLAADLSASATTLQLQYRDTFRTGETVLIDSEQILLNSSNDQITWQVTRARNGTAAASHPAKRVVYGRKFTSWCEAKESNALVYAWTDADVDHPPEGFDPTYPSYQRAALAQALHAGLDVSGIREAFDWLDQLIKSNGKQVYDNWCVAPPTQPVRRIIQRAHDTTDLQHNPDIERIFGHLMGEPDEPSHAPE